MVEVYRALHFELDFTGLLVKNGAVISKIAIATLVLAVPVLAQQTETQDLAAEPEVTLPEPPAAEPQPAPAAPEPPAAEPKAASLADAYCGIVKVEVAKRIPDYSTPWNTGQYGRSNGTAFMVAPGIFMTNAHVVANAQRITISPYADSRLIPAKVKHVAHDADLALLEVEDAAYFDKVPCLSFSDAMPRLEDSVRAIGYPIGGKRLSVTRGIISRIDTITYAHPRNEAHLAVQIDAAINPGNSGGPVLMGDKVVGVAFQGLLEANSTGYMIPLPVVQRFLKDVEDGRYDNYVDMGGVFMPLRNAALRSHYGLPADEAGALVGDVISGGTCDGVLQPGDVVLEINGHAVDSSAMINLDGEHVQLEELAERAFSGDELQFTILRGGQKLHPVAKLVPLPARNIMANEYDALPRYVVYAGLVFQPLQLNVIQAHRLSVTDVMVELDAFQRKGDSAKKDDIVVVTKVLKDEVNARFSDFGKRIVKSVNGVEVTGLAQLHSLLYPRDMKDAPAFTVIEFEEAGRPFVIDNAAVQSANERISAGYNVPRPARLD